MFNEARYQQIPVVNNISDYVSQYASSKADVVAIIDGSRELTYHMLEEEVMAVARALIGQGVKVGDRVACLSHPDIHYLVTLLACASIGAIWVGLNPDYDLTELELVIEDSDPVLVFYKAPLSQSDGSDRDYQKEFRHLTRLQEFKIVQLNGTPVDYAGMEWSEFLAAADDVQLGTVDEIKNSLSSDTPALLVYNSGFTGAPTGVLIHHRGLVQEARMQNVYWHADPVRIINFVPINHIGGVVDIGLFALASGGTQVMMSGFNPVQYNQLMEQHRCTIWAGLPTTLQASVEDPDFASYDLSSIQHIAWSGGSVSQELLSRLKAVCPTTTTSYGLTETVGSICYSSDGDKDEILLNTIGKPVPIYDVRLMTETGHLAKIDEPAEIQCRGDFTMLGYFNRDDLTSESMTEDGWLKTGDLGISREDGNVQIIGQISQSYESGGYIVYPMEVEKTIQSYDGVLHVAILSKPDPLLSEVGVAFLQVENHDSFSVEALKTWCNDNLAEYKIPVEFIVLDKLPLLPVGRVDKRTLQRRVKPTTSSLLK